MSAVIETLAPSQIVQGARERASPVTESSEPSVAILLCTYDGERYLGQQLDSFAAQTHSNWTVWASDDGSHDQSQSILADYQQQWPAGRLHVRSGAGNGFAGNFLSLVCRPEIRADYYAYSDQDDIWEADKLKRALAWLRTVPVDVPGLYCTRTRLVDSEGREHGLSPLFTKPPSFMNALVQNIGGGNTMVFNHATKQLLMRAGSRARIVSHDWWTYILVSGCGGQVCYDPWPSVRYRQHANNIVGANKGVLSRWVRLRKLFHGRYKGWNDLHVRALATCAQLLTDENRHVFNAFSAARVQWLIPRFIGMCRCGVWRQSIMDNIGLLAATILNKI